MNIYDFSVKDYKGNVVALDKYKGKVLLIVNTAIKCGFAKQYDGLEELYGKYKDKGFEILDFPCNQFLNQSPLNSEENHDACILRFAIKFDQFEKIKVNGKEREPLYDYLINHCPVNTGKRIKWNFTKFLVNRDGEVVTRFEPIKKPSEFEDEILKLL